MVTLALHMFTQKLYKIYGKLEEEKKLASAFLNSIVYSMAVTYGKAKDRQRTLCVYYMIAAFPFGLVARRLQ